MDKKFVWRNYARYRLQRIDYFIQEQIIDWLDDYYNFDLIGLDLGSGGNGPAMYQGLAGREEYKSKAYTKRLIGVNFNESITVGKNDETGLDMRKDTKSLATEELVRKIEDKMIIFSEIDAEGTSELERIGKQKSITGADKYFVISETGKGRSNSDHHFASCLVFAMMVRGTKVKKKKLARSSSFIERKM